MKKTIVYLNHADDITVLKCYLTNEKYNIRSDYTTHHMIAHKGNNIIECYLK